MDIKKRKPYFDDFEFGDELWIPEYEQLSSEHTLYRRIISVKKSTKTNLNNRVDENQSN